MLRKIPISAADLSAAKVLSTIFFSRNAIQEAKDRIEGLVYKKEIIFMNSGLSCFYALLYALKSKSDKKEVVMPAYTAGSLIVAVKEAGLKPVLCDINMQDFNMDHGQLENVISENTLCIVVVHMFGIIDAGIDKLKSKYPDCFIVEDACQSMGGRMNNVLVSESADISLFSFNKGKNISTFGGGCIVTNNLEIAQKISKRTNQLKGAVILENLQFFMKMFALSIVINPWIYGVFYSFISRFKDTKPPERVLVKDYRNIQAAALSLQLEDMDDWANKRYDNARIFLRGLKDQEGLILPSINVNARPAFNRMPIVFKDLGRLKKAEETLCENGVETSRMYFKPLHKMFDIGYKLDDFPNAVYFAEHLLSVPCHPGLNDKDIDKIITIING